MPTNPIHQELISRLNYIRIQPKTVGLFGAFSPEEQAQIAGIYPKAKLIAEASDYLLPRGGGQGGGVIFDVILASDIPGERALYEPIFEAFKQSLKPGGMLLFTQLGWDYDQAFPDMHDIGDLLLHLGFENPVVDTEFNRIFGHAWAKQFQEKTPEGSIKSVRVSLESLMASLKKPFRRK